MLEMTSMKRKQSAVWEKLERDQALNVSELVEASGYSRASLRQMKLPLVCGKIPYSDFRRLLQKLQNEEFAALRATPARVASASPVVNQSMQALVDKLRSPRPVDARAGKQHNAQIRALMESYARLTR
jgi:hypothetical protein